MLRPLTCSLIALALLPAAAAAETKTFQTANGDWFTASNWTPAGVPVAGDDVVVKGGYAVGLSAATPAYKSVTIGGTATIVAGGRLDAEATSVVNGGHLRGGGTVAGPVSNPSGWVQVFDDQLTIEGDYTQAAGGRLATLLGGTDPGTGYGRLAVTGTASLTGTLQVSTTLKFTPPAPGTYDVLTAGATTGQFSVTKGLEPFTLSYPGDAVRLVAAGAAPPAPTPVVAPPVAKPAPVPVATPVPVPAPRPAAPPAPAAPAAPAPLAAPAGPAPTVVRADVLGLPKAKACVSRRAFRIRLRAPRGERLASATLFLNARHWAAVKGRRLTAPVDLRGLPRGRFTVRILAVTKAGKALESSRTYRTCARKRA